MKLNTFMRLIDLYQKKANINIKHASKSAKERKSLLSWKYYFNMGVKNA
jgi:hypothetical protein